MVPATRMWRLPSRRTWRGVNAGHIRATLASAARTDGVCSAAGSIRSGPPGWPGRRARSTWPSAWRASGSRLPTGGAVSGPRSPSAVRPVGPSGVRPAGTTRASVARPSTPRGATGRLAGGACLGPVRPAAAVGGRSAGRVAVGVGVVAEEYMG